MTVDELYVQWRADPNLRDFVDKCYLGEDTLASGDRFYRSEEFRALTELILQNGVASPATLLDLGGGNGVSSLAWLRAGYQVVLAEPNPGEVAGLGSLAPALREHRLCIRLVRAVGEALPFHKETFDVVYCRQVLHHVGDLDAACREMYRVLRPGGLFIATREHVISRKEDLEAFLENHPAHKYTRDEQALLLSEYLRSLKRAGFNRVKVIGSWQSVVNYYPTPESEFAGICRAALRRRFGKTVGGYLGARTGLFPFYGWYLTRRDHRPGRMYSFVAKR